MDWLKDVQRFVGKVPPFVEEHHRRGICEQLRVRCLRSRERSDRRKSRKEWPLPDGDTLSLAGGKAERNGRRSEQA